MSSDIVFYQVYLNIDKNLDPVFTDKNIQKKALQYLLYDLS